jgi:hypothetical protein
MIRRARAHRRGGSVVITDSNSLRYRILGNLFDCHEITEIVVVQIFTKDGRLTVASCHKPPANTPFDRNEWFRFIAQFKGVLIIGGEYYVHNIE